MARLSGVRLTEVLGAMSLAVDLGLGQPMGHVARSCLLAQRLGNLVGLAAGERDELYYVSLMGWVGCIADSRAAAAEFGDDISYRAGVYDLDMRPLPFLGYLVRRVRPQQPVARRLAGAAALLATGAREVQGSLRAHCQVTVQVAERLGLPAPVRAALPQVFARWDGRGLPEGLRGGDLARSIRLWHLADVAEVHHAHGGVEASVRVVRERRGTQFDPELVDLFIAHAAELLEVLVGPDAAGWETVAAGLGPPAGELTEEELDQALQTVGDWVDLKSPYFTGHSRAVADLTAAAARSAALADPDVTLARRAGMVHDLGRVGVPNTIWDKTGPLSAPEAERIRLHSYYTERMLTSPPALAGIGAIAGAAHERLDGSGYHRGRSAADLPMAARVLAAADCYCTSIEDRPHRPAHPPTEAAGLLRREASAGRLDPVAVQAVLGAAGATPTRRRTGTAGLTPREVEVLTLLARGSTNRQIAQQLTITPKTVGNHVEHIYTKAGVGTRAAATLFAMQHGLL